MKIHHIGYLVKNINKAMDDFLLLGYERVDYDGKKYNDAYVNMGGGYDNFRKIDIIFMRNANYIVELVSPTSPDSVVSDLIKRIKNSPYHICYSSDNFNKDIDFLKSNGFVQIDNPLAAPAMQGKRVVFFASPNIGLIELLEI